LFKLWADVAPGFFPDRYGGYEPLRQEFSLARLDEALKWWEHQFLLKRVASPKLESSIFMQNGPQNPFFMANINKKDPRIRPKGFLSFVGAVGGKLFS
jgi:hypothetical protein